MTSFYLQESTHKRDLDLATKSRTLPKETKSSGACSRRETKSSEGADQRGLGEHDSRNEKEKQKSVLAPTEPRNRLWNQRTKEMNCEKGASLARSRSWTTASKCQVHRDGKSNQRSRDQRQSKAGNRNTKESWA
jgi:hypothetical protein